MLKIFSGTTVLTLAALAVGLLATTSRADARRIRICNDGHYHYGSSQGHRTRARALAAAIEDWRGFTGWEYGDAWSYWRRAYDRHVSCAKSGRLWGCEISATPCRLR